MGCLCEKSCSQVLQVGCNAMGNEFSPLERGYHPATGRDHGVARVPSYEHFYITI